MQETRKHPEPSSPKPHASETSLRVKFTEAACEIPLEGLRLGVWTGREADQIQRARLHAGCCKQLGTRGVFIVDVVSDVSKP